MESLRVQLAAAEAATELAQHDAWATRAAMRYSIPESLIDRLQGNSEDELMADAEKFSGLIKNGGTTGTTGVTPAKPVESEPQAPAAPPTQRPTSPVRGAVATPAVDAIALVQKKLAASI